MKSILQFLVFIVAASHLLPSMVIGQDLHRVGKWQGYVAQCLDTLIEHGTDVYGAKSSPLLMAVIDVRTHTSPKKPELLDSLVRLEERLHRRAERGSNLWYDQATLRTMYRLSELTHDSKYSSAANAYVGYALEHCYKPVDDSTSYANGMLCWGSHIHWDCYQDCPGGDGDGIGPHEILVYQAEWKRMYAVNPKAVGKLVDGIWKWHIVDKTTGQHNRHDDGKLGCDFAFSGGSFVQAFAAMYNVTNDSKYLEQAKLVANWHWRNRDQDTGLVADSPGIRGRHDGQHCFTTIVGPHAASLLRSYELTGDSFFREIAIQYIKAYDRFGWDENAETYHAMLELNGRPVPDRAKGPGYDAWTPYGHVNVWRTSIFSYEFTLAAAQAAIYAYELSSDNVDDRDADLLRIAKRWSQVIKQQLPAQTGRRWKKELEAAMPRVQQTGGAYAEDYGRAISFYVHLHRATDDAQFRKIAEQLADEAISKLFTNGLFRGHPAKPYYEATNGVGLLLWSLLELDAEDKTLAGAF